MKVFLAVLIRSKLYHATFISGYYQFALKLQWINVMKALLSDGFFNDEFPPSAGPCGVQDRAVDNIRLGLEARFDPTSQREEEAASR